LASSKLFQEGLP